MTATNRADGVPTGAPRDVVAVTGELISSRRMGAFVAHTFVAPGVAELARPGQLVSFAVGDEGSAIVTRRALPLKSVTASGTYGGTIEVVLDADADAGSAWLAGRRLHDEVNVLGPLGRGFPIPTSPVPVVVVAAGAGAASVLWLVETLRRAGCQVPRVVIGGPDERRLINVIEARRLVGSVVTVLPRPDAGESLEYGLQVATDRVLAEAEPALVYASGDVASLAAVTAAAQRRSVPVQAAFGVPMPCGTGLCRACMLPVANARGDVTPVRCCTEGPVLPADRIAWGDLMGTA